MRSSATSRCWSRATRCCGTCPSRSTARSVVVYGNRVDLQRVLLNVVTSADAVASAPFAAPGERADGGDPTSGTVLVIVRDRGPGLAEGSEEQIFEPFVTTKASGMGMGLAVARSLVDNHGGSIRAANHPEGGAVVTISIPALAARVASPVAAVHS